MMLTWELSLILLAVLLILWFLKQLWSRRHFPPGPLPLPIIGSIWRTGTGLGEDILIKLAKQYGNIYTIWIGHYPIVILSGYQAVKEGLIKYSEEFSGRPVTNFFKQTLKRKGLVLSNGHTWKQQRKFGVVTMRKLGLGKKGMEQQIKEEAHWLVDTFARAKGQPLDPLLPIMNAVSRVICVLSFGYRLSLEDEKFREIIEAVEFILKYCTTVVHFLGELFPWLIMRLPGPQHKALSFTQLVLSFAKTEVAKHKECQTLHEPQDFIDFYLLQIEKSNGDPTSTYNEENLSECIFDLFVAGTETTAITLQWALLLMVANPDIQDKVYKEMEDVLGPSHSICYEDRKRLPYTNAVIHEVLRVKYALPIGIPRRCVKDVNMHGFIIPKGTFVIPDLRSVLLDPKQWRKPREFNPQNFLDQDGNFMPREDFLPFGAGHRVCLGEQMAKMELFFFFTKLLRTFRLQLPEGVTEKEINKEPVMGLAFHPHPFKLCAIPHYDSS
ncbi:cytochrome P450 2J4-like [Elgaria multicarinata webbii]|uniref:cytochrome P450 2J4-like n=1 Tax=Elgaria multicarinata webbii TaxID=159646 RepID=UPI002FCCEE76